MRNLTCLKTLRHRAQIDTRHARLDELYRSKFASLPARLSNRARLRRRSFRPVSSLGPHAGLRVRGMTTHGRCPGDVSFRGLASPCDMLRRTHRSVWQETCLANGPDAPRAAASSKSLVLPGQTNLRAYPFALPVTEPLIALWFGVVSRGFALAQGMGDDLNWPDCRPGCVSPCAGTALQARWADPRSALVVAVSPHSGARPPWTPRFRSTWAGSRRTCRSGASRWRASSSCSTRATRSRSSPATARSGPAT